MKPNQWMQTFATRDDGPVATLTMNRPDKRNAMMTSFSVPSLTRFSTKPARRRQVVILRGRRGIIALVWT